MQVTVLNMDQLEPQEEDVVVMATDGLWDVLSNEQVARLVRSFLPGNREDPHRYCSCWGSAWTWVSTSSSIKKYREDNTAEESG